MTNAEAIARVLAEHGVEYAYGLPGGEVVVLVDALRRAGIQFHLVGHEASAAFMAGVTGEITGRPGVCVATLGPGATNLVTGVACAYLERAPMLAFTAQISHDLYASFTHQRLALDRLFAPITKESVWLDGFDTAGKVEAAYDLARGGRPGPVHIAMSSDLAARDVRETGRAARVSAPVSGGTRSGDGEERGDAGPVRAVIQAIRGAKQPLVLVGLGARPEDAPAVRRLLDVTHWPWMTTPKGKGIVPETHPRFLGVASGMAIDQVILEGLDLADLIVAIGFDPVECDKAWFLNRRMASVSRWPTAEGDYRPLEAVGAIDAIVNDLAAHFVARAWPDDVIADRRRAIHREPGPADARPDAGPSGAGLSPLAVLRALREVLPEETVVACDVGSHKLLAGQFWSTTQPQTFFMSNGLSSMGYGLPAAMAAALHLRGRPVAALVGDGGMLMMAHNLPFIARLALPILTVVLTDGSLSLIRIGQVRRGFPAYGTDFTAPDFTRIAAASGIAAARAGRLDDVRRYADHAIRTRTPFLLDVPIDLREYQALM